MTVNIDKKKYVVSDRVLAAAEKKLKKLERYFDDSAVADLKFSEVKGIKVAEITVKSANMYFRAEERSGDAYAAMDNAAEAIERQIIKHKTRLEKRLKKDAFEKFVAEQKDDRDAAMIRRKRFELKPMTEEEAALQMEMLNHQFFLFKNAELGSRICVVYKRDDDGYGIIESE